MLLHSFPIRETNTIVQLGQQQPVWARELHEVFDRNGRTLEKTSRHAPSGGLTRDLYERTESGLLITHKHFKAGQLLYELVNEAVCPGTHIRTMLIKDGVTSHVHEEVFLQNGQVKERHEVLGSAVEATWNRRYNVEGSRRVVAVPGAIRRVVTYNADEQPLSVSFVGERGPLLVVSFKYFTEEIHEEFYDATSDKSRLAWKRLRKLDKHGDVRISDEDPSGQEVALHTFAYNTNGDVVAEDLSSASGHVFVAHEFSYDDKNNWIEHVIKASNGHYERRERTIVYYGG